jgi:hypothetical protein
MNEPFVILYPLIPLEIREQRGLILGFSVEGSDGD